MKKTLLALAVFSMASIPAIAEENPGKELAKLAFKTVNEADRGMLDIGEMEKFRELVFLSMDADENERLSLEEFMGWGFGMSNIAEDKNRVTEYETALKVIFNIWDIDGNGEIAPSEHRKSIRLDFERADRNGDSLLTENEFLNGFSINAAFRAALQ